MLVVFRRVELQPVMNKGLSLFDPAVNDIPVVSFDFVHIHLVEEMTEFPATKWTRIISFRFVRSSLMWIKFLLGSKPGGKARVVGGSLDLLKASTVERPTHVLRILMRA